MTDDAATPNDEEELVAAEHLLRELLSQGRAWSAPTAAMKTT